MNPIKEYVGHLNDTGILSISRWVVTPARDNLKMFNMVIKALRQMGIDDVQKHLIAIRSLQTLTLLVSRFPIPDPCHRMGIPFPCALNFLKGEDEFSLAWAWGINGFISVISILLATVLAVIFGFKAVMMIAMLCYGIAGVLSCQFIKKNTEPGS